jgi:hypothetical protein
MFGSPVPDFKNPKKVSNGDSQRAGFNWGTGELVSFKNTDGVAFAGLAAEAGQLSIRKRSTR